MHIEIHDAALEARMRRQIQATGASTPEEALLHLLETQEEQDRWLMENRELMNIKIRRGIERFDRGDGYRKTNWTRCGNVHFTQCPLFNLDVSEWLEDAIFVFCRDSHNPAASWWHCRHIVALLPMGYDQSVPHST